MKIFRLLRFSFLFSFLHLHALDVVSLSTPFVNHHIFVDENFLEKNVEGEKGGRESIQYDQMWKIIKESHQQPQIEMSGSGMDVTYTLSSLGLSCKTIGQIGEDAIATLYKEDLDEKNITYRFAETNLPTGQVLCIVTPDGQRTMRTFLGAATHKYGNFKVTDLDFADAKLLHVEGYQLEQPKFVKNVMKLAKEKGLKISLDLACFEIVKALKTEILEILTHYVDIVFANEDESSELLQLNPKEAAEKLAEICEIAVVTMGERGGFVSSFGKTFHYPAIHVTTLDSTGAGDQFAAGFLYGYFHQMPLRKSAYLGSRLASEIVQIARTRHAKKDFEELKKELTELGVLSKLKSQRNFL